MVISKDMGIKISQGQLLSQGIWITLTNISVHYITTHNQYMMLKWPKQKICFKHTSQAQIQSLPKALIFLSTEPYFPSSFTSAWTSALKKKVLSGWQWRVWSKSGSDKSSLNSKNIKQRTYTSWGNKVQQLLDPCQWGHLNRHHQHQDAGFVCL